MSEFQKTSNEYSKIDTSSFSNPDKCAIRHIHLDWKIDFDNKIISGSCSHNAETLIEATEFIDFDSRDLRIESVTINGDPVHFVTGEANAALGTKISVSIPLELRSKGSKFEVVFVYSQHSNATAVQWLDKEATKGRCYPFVFTQCQAIHARSLLPCQDSPGCKVTYSAIIDAPDWCTVLMSALAQESNVPGKFYWRQPVPTSTYLIALAAGNLSFRNISPRVRVWSEPEIVDDVAFEFSETEDFLTVAEGLTCPYEWTRYDVLCLPPSFPYGGMENPCLTFATPTLLAGDKSLADVIAHEIAHSWTGNLVTNATWEHFWLNEGWTVWLERKIMSRLRGIEFLKLSAQGGWKHLRDDVISMGLDNPFTMLVWPLNGEDPDDAFSGIPYEKGFNLLYKLETIVGTESFEEFAKAYIQKFKSTPVTSGEFRDFFVAYFSSGPVETTSEIAAIDWNKIFFSPGLPESVPDFSNSLSMGAETLAKAWIALASSPSGAGSVIDQDISGWNTQQKCIFLEALSLYSEENEELSEEVLCLLDQKYNFSESKNSEIMMKWQTLCLLSEVEWIIPQVVNFITSQGRMKFVRPLYRRLFVSTIGNETAVKTFVANNKMYHPIARKMIASDLKITLE